MDKCEFCGKQENYIPTRYYDVDRKGLQIPTGQKRVLRIPVSLCRKCFEESELSAVSPVRKWLDQKLRPSAT